MSIASAIQTKQQQVAQAYTAVSNKGGTLPSTRNLENLATAINSISSTPTLITKTLESNGVYDASSYDADGFSTVTVDVAGSSLITRNITENGTYSAQDDGADGYSSVTVNVPQPLLVPFVALENGNYIASDLGFGGFSSVSVNTPYIFREVTSSGVYQAPSSNFVYNLPSGVSNLGSFSLAYSFYGCLGITEANFSGLESITGEKALQKAFANCTNLTEVSFPALSSTFFGTNTDQFNDMLLGVTGCTVHFPSNLETVIDSWADVVSGFGGTSTIVLFDLEPTE